MGPAAALLPDGKRLHLQHGPIDLIIGAEGARTQAFEAAKARFETVLEEIAADLPALRAPSPAPLVSGRIGQRMQASVAPFDDTFVTPMAAVAGTVADTVLAAMVKAANPWRAYVNNGGDIAIHLDTDQRFRMAMAGHDGQLLGQIEVYHDNPVRGLATSGRHGRSLSLGIADSVTVLAQSAAMADVAATLIANAVDLPGHRAIKRLRACEIDENSDLGEQWVVTGCQTLSTAETETALNNGLARARSFQNQGLITSACLFLNGQARTTDTQFIATEKVPEHA